MPNALFDRFVLTMWLCCCSTAAAQSPEISFNQHIRPLLSDACFSCHGPDAAHREADLRLDEEASAKAHVLRPGEPQESEIWLRLTAEDPDLVMPPPETGKTFSPAELTLIKQWIESGAPYEPFWAYSPPKPQATPDVGDDAWPSDAIDAFILKELRQNGLTPSQAADLPTLLRRVTFDLTGLPPDPDTVKQLQDDPRPAAYARYVDRLLASPAFGERMAAYWLDLVRFADTVGYHGDQDHNISPYRDYVVDAFNQNLPFDQFTREQLAGDLLEQPTVDQLVATGYNRLLQTSHEGGVQPKEYLSIYAADRIRNLSAVWMGATIGCAQCHDHKYDPYTAHDFYSLVAFFADIDEAQHFDVGSNSLPTQRPPEMIVLPPWDRPELQRLDRQLERWQRQADLGAAGDAEQLAAKIAALQARRQQWLSRGRKTMITQAISPRPIRVLPRGNWLDDSGPLVEPQVPTFLPPLPVQDRRANRLDLANWLVDAKEGVGGLTARVMVNRFWYLLMGRGLSSSLADFGGQGEPPSHPELLDQLAIDFVAGGWDVKQLLRRMVLTDTYRQSSVASPRTLQLDPNNRWFSRQQRYRLPAEMVRDNALAVGGLLTHQVGGRSVKPWQPEGYYRHLNFPTRVYQADSGGNLWRRGVYVHWQRQFLHPMLKALDAPNREECTAERARSNTPLEALVLLNDPSLVEAAQGLAHRITEPSLSVDDTIELAFEIVLTRPPSPFELSTLRDHYHVEGSGQAAWLSVCRVLLNLHETVTRN